MDSRDAVVDLFGTDEWRSLASHHARPADVHLVSCSPTIRPGIGHGGPGR